MVRSFRGGLKEKQTSVARSAGGLAGCAPFWDTAISHLGDDVGDKVVELFALLFRIASTVAHNHMAIAQINQASEVVHDIRLGTRARIPVTVRAFPGFSYVDKELMAKAEVGKTSPLCLAQLLERV
jgi:hypothetical protein